MTDLLWHGCVVPEDLLHDVGLNVWVQLAGDTAVLGMTDVAQTLCGRMVQVS
jgi:glycine cleavage system H protein